MANNTSPTVTDSTNAIEWVRDQIKHSPLKYQFDILDHIEWLEAELENGELPYSNTPIENFQPDPETPNELGAWSLGVLLGYYLRVLELEDQRRGLRVVADGEICEVDDWIEGEPVLRPKNWTDSVENGDSVPVVDIQLVRPGADDIIATVEGVDFNV